MNDTQWPRFEVFKQDTPGKPHQAVGSVHAPDLEMALLMARDVFVRRPRCHSLWVTPADAIFSITQEELEAQPAWLTAPPAAAPAATETYLVFRKTSQRRAMTFVEHVGEVVAASPQAAVQQALTQFATAPTWVWWVVPAGAVAQSDAEDSASWFEPADDKTYRHQSAYGFVSPRRQRRGPADPAS